MMFVYTIIASSASLFTTVQICRTFTTNGTCPYGTRCRFIHNSSPAISSPKSGSLSSSPTRTQSVGAEILLSIPPCITTHAMAAEFQSNNDVKQGNRSSPSSPPPFLDSPRRLRIFQKICTHSHSQVA